MHLKDEEFIRAILITAMKIENMAEKGLYQPFGLSSAGITMLLLLKKQGACSPTDIKKLIGSTKSNITQRLNLLIKKGLVERAAAEQDGRMISVKLTANGEKTAEDILAKISQGELLASKFFTPQELADHMAFFRKLNGLIDSCSSEYINS